MKTTYLERTDESGRHRWYSATAQGRRVIYRWGRIGHAGDELIIDCPTTATALELVRDKVAEKRRRGYVDAAPGRTRPLPVAGRPQSRTLPLFPDPDTGGTP